MTKFIYKICSISDWLNLQKKRKFHGTKKDLLDGYIHFSRRNQVEATLKKHFFRKKNLILLKVKILKIKDLKWEKSREGKLFPHLYSFLDIKDVKSTYKISLNKNGLHIIEFER